MKTERYCKLPKAIARRRDLRASAKIVFATIMDRIGKNDDCWPGIATIAKDAGISHTAVLRSIKALESKGLVIVSRSGNGRSNHYRIPATTGNETLLVADEDRARGKTSSDSSPTQPRNDTQTGSKTIIGPVAKRYVNQTNEPDPKNETLNYTGFDAFWNAWPSHPRKRSKSKCRDRWNKDKLDERAAHVIAVVDALKQSHDWLKDRGNYIPAPLAWLNQQCWDCDISDIEGGSVDHEKGF